MSALLKLVPPATTMSDVPALLGADPWVGATEAQRRTAELRQAVVQPLAQLVDSGVGVTRAAGLLLAQWEAGTLAADRAMALTALGREGGEDGGGAVSLATLKRWVAAYRAQGVAGLLPRHTGRVRQAQGWELRAVALYNRPSKPGYADVAFTLRAEGFEGATESRVKRYLKSLPATLGEHSPARLGRHLHKLRRQHYQRRSVAELLVGEMYAGDGHTVDCYVAHPNTGKPFRPELTAFIDIKSRYLAGWYFTESESAQSTMFALSSAMVRHDHVPAWLYIDRGAGYRARMLSDEATGWYGRFDIEVIGALPGNPHGKGWIERFFRTCRDKHDKFFADGLAYCGDDMAPEINRRLSAELAQGRRQLPSLRDYVASFARFIDAYHDTPMDVLDGRTPAQVWAELQPVAVAAGADAVLRPRQEATVQRQTVRLHNRFYFHEALALYDGRRVVVEYDLHTDGKVWVLDSKQRLVCEAKLVNAIGVLPTSRLEEQRDRRLAGQLKRLERKVDEARARREDAITQADQLGAIEALEHDFPEVLPPAAAVAAPTLTEPRNPTRSPGAAGTGNDADGDEPVIDILDWKE